MAKKPYLFQQIAKYGKDLGVGRPDLTRKSQEWFRKAARSVATVDLDRLHDSAPKSRMQATIRGDDIGSLFHFWYDAKTKDKLPYWDRHPLVMPIEIYKDGFLGVNFHYISPYQRSRLMNALYEQAQYDSKGRPARLDVSYGLLKSASQFAPFKPCVKRYLRSHYQSRFMWITPDEWDMALMLPTAVWVGSVSPTKIHRASASSFKKN